MATAPQRRPEETLAPGLLARYRAELQAGLEAALGHGEPALLTMLRYHMGWVDEQGRPGMAPQGKALRPVLCLFCCEALGGSASQAMPAAVALELVHNFSLIHDDIQDGDRERRHRPTVWYLWGKPQAIVAGNAMRALADQALLELQYHGFPPSRVLRASAVLTQAYLCMIEGQYLDLSYEERPTISVQEYLDMVGKKTGALFEAALRLGSLLGTKDDAAVETMSRCGFLLGLAFQVQDDILGIWGDGATTGKAAGADIRRRKKSFPVVYAFEAAPQEQRARLAELYGRKELGEAEVQEVVRLLESVSARDFAQELAQEKCAAALAAARDAPLPAWAQGELEEMAEFLVRRAW